MTNQGLTNTGDIYKHSHINQNSIKTQVIVLLQMHILEDVYRR